MIRFSPEALRAVLAALPKATAYWIAFSGGQDSCVLLHALAALRNALEAPLQAAHVNHGLHADASSWAQSCTEVCEHHAIPLSVVQLDARHPVGNSPEAWARERRYLALQALMHEGEMMLTAHHRDDQAETLLMQLLRGSGPRGLAGMPPLVRWGAGWLARPLLAFDRADLAAYAEAHLPGWVEDPSNTDTRYARNFLRHAVLPVLKTRWPSLGATLARAALWQAEAAALIDEIAEQDLLRVASGAPAAVSVSRLRRLPEARRRNVLRVWLVRCGLPSMTAVQLQQLAGEALECRWDSRACIRWPGGEVRRYRDDFYAMRPLRPHDANQVFGWNCDAPLALPLGTLTVERGADGIRAAACVNDSVTVRFRRGGERLRPCGSSHTRLLKHLFQEQGIPPWRRDRIPLVYLGPRLAAVAGFWRHQALAADPGEIGLCFRWTESEENGGAVPAAMCVGSGD
ncbi:MAG: tRNA lysidine(34) synthetase TilS [Chromatiales bacterium]